MNELVSAGKNLPAALAGAQTGAEVNQYLTFMLGGEMYSLGILSIKEIIWYSNLTEVPMMPPCIRGIINLRGAVVPVMDLSIRFGKPSTPVVKSTCIVIVEVPKGDGSEQMNMGIVVDSVQAVLAIPRSEMEPPPTFGSRIRADFIDCIAKVNGKFVILLNISKVLSSEEIEQMGQGSASTEVAERHY